MNRSSSSATLLGLAAWGLALALVLCCPAGARATAKDDLRAGFASLRLGDTAEAIKLFSKAIGSGHLGGADMVVALGNRGRAYTKLRRFDQAIGDYRRALEIARPEENRTLRAAIYEGMGHAYLRRGQFQQAKDELDRALALNPKLPWALSYRARAHGQLRKDSLALADLDRAIAIRPYHRFYYQRSHVLARMGVYQKALADINQALKQRPNRPAYQSWQKHLKKLVD